MKPIETLHLFQDLNQELIYFLADLKPDEWLLPSPIDGRSIKDLASHLVDGCLRRISMQRDHFFEAEAIVPQNHHELVEFIQQKNFEWIVATRRLSSRVLVEMLKKYEQEVYELYCRLKPEDDALFSVSWAGQEKSPNWFDVARDYTEKWHHQMQMRLASGRNLLMSERFLTPLYETLLLGLPEQLNRSAFSITEQLLEVEITGEIRLRKRLINYGSHWEFHENLTDEAHTSVKIPASIGWILFTNTDRDKGKYLDQIQFTGNEALAKNVVHLTAVMS
jgi:hypothetical protein